MPIALDLKFEIFKYFVVEPISEIYTLNDVADDEAYKG